MSAIGGSVLRPDVLIVGAGPAGLCAAAAAAEAGADVLIMERAHAPGGQLVKQTHMFFGGRLQYASTRGIDIATILFDAAVRHKNVRMLLNAFVLSAYEDGVYIVEADGELIRVCPRTTIFASGAQEKTLPIPGADLPGVYGAGAIQTLMNQYGIMPARRVVMLGAGNIGLIVSYQLLQAGVKVLAVLEGGPKIGGYLVHAAKLRRMGVPILTRHSVKCVNPTPYQPHTVGSITAWQLDAAWAGVPGTEITYEADCLGVAVGLSPLCELMWQVGCKMAYIPALGGHVPCRRSNFETSVSGVFVAGDAGGVEEASSAMVTGTLAGLFAARHLDLHVSAEKITQMQEQLNELRHGEIGQRITDGVALAAL